MPSRGGCQRRRENQYLRHSHIIEIGIIESSVYCIEISRIVGTSLSQRSHLRGARSDVSTCTATAWVWSPRVIPPTLAIFAAAKTVTLSVVSSKRGLSVIPPPFALPFPTWMREMVFEGDTGKVYRYPSDPPTKTLPVTKSNTGADNCTPAATVMVLEIVAPAKRPGDDEEHPASLAT